VGKEISEAQGARDIAASEVRRLERDSVNFQAEVDNQDAKIAAASDVYRMALDHMKVDLKGVPASAYGATFRAVRAATAERPVTPRIAQDSAGVADYEKRFGAYLASPELRKIYNERKKGFLEKPPKEFSFQNKDLNEMLGLIYSESSSWKEFFEKIQDMPNNCEIMFPWYKNALSSIFKSVSFERQEWIINLYQNPKVFPVKYSKITILKGGRRKTKRSDSAKYKYDLYNSNQYYDKLDYEVIYNLKYK
jgi:hypothetical protein